MRSDDRAPTSPYLLVLCRPGAEASIKAEAEAVGLRLSYSRKGLITFKAEREVTVDDEIPAVLAHLEAVSLGALGADPIAGVKEKLAGLSGVRLHVMPGAIDRAALLAGTGDLFVAEARPEPGDLVATIVWAGDAPWLALHRHRLGRSPFPGGVADIPLPEAAPSRAYLKLEEAIAQFGLDLRRGEHAIEIGCSPGGASYALLQRGLHVVGIDPNKVDERVRTHRNFRHIRETSMRADPRWIKPPVEWLLLDVNVPPGTALRGALPFVDQHYDTLRGLIFTLKLKDLAILPETEGWLHRIHRAVPGFAIEARQLSSNGQEFCVVAQRRR